MGSQSLVALEAKRAEISECMRLLEHRSSGRGNLALNRLMASLRLKAEWLDKRIDLELRRSTLTETATATKLPRPVNAA